MEHPSWQTFQNINQYLFQTITIANKAFFAQKNSAYKGRTDNMGSVDSICNHMQEKTNSNSVCNYCDDIVDDLSIEYSIAHLTS